MAIHQASSRMLEHPHQTELTTVVGRRSDVQKLVQLVHYISLETEGLGCAKCQDLIQILQGVLTCATCTLWQSIRDTIVQTTVVSMLDHRRRGSVPVVLYNLPSSQLSSQSQPECKAVQVVAKPGRVNRRLRVSAFRGVSRLLSRTPSVGRKDINGNSIPTKGGHREETEYTASNDGEPHKTRIASYITVDSRPDLGVVFLFSISHYGYPSLPLRSRQASQLNSNQCCWSGRRTQRD